MIAYRMYIKQLSRLYAMYWFCTIAFDMIVLRGSLESERDELPRRSQRPEISQALLSFHLISFQCHFLSILLRDSLL